MHLAHTPVCARCTPRRARSLSRREKTDAPHRAAPPPPLSTSAHLLRRPPFHSQEPDYIHAPSMYDIPSMTNRKLKFGLAVGGVVLGGFAVPAIAANHQQKRAAG